MKKLSFTLLVWLMALTISAEGYNYLTFELTEGTKVSIPAESLTMTFSGTILKTGEQTFTLENLKKMYFSTSDETMGISEVKGLMGEPRDIYDLQGRKVTKEQMRSGQVYVVKTTNGINKMTVK